MHFSIAEYCFELFLEVRPCWDSFENDTFRGPVFLYKMKEEKICLLTGSSPRRRLLMTKKRSSHGVMIILQLFSSS